MHSVQGTRARDETGIQLYVDLTLKHGITRLENSRVLDYHVGQVKLSRVIHSSRLFLP